MQWEWGSDALNSGEKLCGKCSWTEHGPWHLEKGASKVTLLMPLVKKQIKHYQGSEETHGQRCLGFALDTCRYPVLNRMYYMCCTCWETLTFHFTDATLNGRSSASEGITGTPVSSTPQCICTFTQWGQLIEQYPGSDKRARRRNPAQWCHLVPPRGGAGTSPALPCRCWGSLNNNYLLYLH